MGTPRRTTRLAPALVALAVLVAAVALGGSASGSPTAPRTLAQPITDTVTTPASGTGGALLSGVQVRSAGGVDEVVFQYTGPDLPQVSVYQVDQLLTIPGEPVPVDGAAVLGVSMFPASAFDLGNACTEAAPAVVPGAGQKAVGVAFTCKNPTAGPWPAVRASRAVTESADPSTLLAEAVTELLGGPNAAEQSAGFSSPFTAATGSLLVSATVAADGSAIVDLDQSLATVLPAPSSSVAEEVLRNLDGTLQQFPSITSAEYRLGGSCTAFFAWLGQACAPRTSSDLADAGFARTYTGPDRVTGATVNVTEAVIVSDFEATLAWGIGLRVDVPVTVRSDPEAFRVIVEVPQSPASPPTTVSPVAATPSFTG
jgi:hypothetical protein